MPSMLGRNLNLCFLKVIRSSAPNSTPMSPSRPNSDDHSRPLPNASISSSSSSILIRNFNSLYDHTLDYYSTSKSLSNSSSNLSTTSSPSTSLDPEPADFATAFASQRFFFSSPGCSNSIVESTNINNDNMAVSSPIATPNHNNSDSNKDRKLFNNSVAVPTYSPDPYSDFRRSMQEMVEARAGLMDVKSNWESLHELLLCYLALNPRNTHKFILGAFADLLVSLMSSKPAEATGR